jgi:glutaredoxin-like protein NrdH
MQKESVTLFTKPGCGACIATKRAFKSQGTQYTEKDITQDQDAFDYVTKKLGYSQMPVVETDSDNWSGLEPDKIKNIK